MNSFNVLNILWLSNTPISGMTRLAICRVNIRILTLPSELTVASNGESLGGDGVARGDCGVAELGKFTNGG